MLVIDKNNDWLIIHLKLIPDSDVGFDESISVIHHDSVVILVLAESEHNFHSFTLFDC